jgi:hypothetical protein
VHTDNATGAWRALAVAGVLTVLLLGSVPAAHATPAGERDQAVRAARSYLDYQGFSFKSLVSQLKYEGFSTADATYGASHSGANWMKEAAESAKSYLRFQAFSRTGLIAQLKYEGFTSAQAAYGVRAAGL